MGLGPPVCEKCRVYGDIDLKARLLGISRWHCPICDNDNMQWSAWDCGLTDEELKANERFLKFVKGMDDASTDG